MMAEDTEGKARGEAPGQIGKGKLWGKSVIIILLSIWDSIVKRAVGE